MIHYKGHSAKNLLVLSCILILAAGCTVLAPVPFSNSKPVEMQVTSPKLKQWLTAALAQTKVTRTYDPAYVAIALLD